MLPNSKVLPPAGAFTFNASEYRARLSGAALANFVNGLPNANARYLIAHSAGNIVAGVALQKHMQVTRYAMCNAAVGAMAYNGALAYDYDYDTPDTDSDAHTMLTYGLANKFNLIPGKIVNFCLPRDHALGTWSFNNARFKPETWCLTDGSFYDYSPHQLDKLGYNKNSPGIKRRPVLSIPEVFGYVTQSLTCAAGAKGNTGGNSIGSTVNMGHGGFEFDEEHSAEWVYSLQRTHPFWRRVAKEFDLNLTNR